MTPRCWRPSPTTWPTTCGNARLAIYDFLYLALAVALDCPLVTADRVFYDALKKTSPHAPYLLWVADPIPDEEDATP